MLDFFNPSCKHEKITAGLKSGYCPDCGEYVENHWFITRCSCCGIKQITVIRNGKAVSNVKFCRNCGSKSFKAEELDEINIVDINYAAVLKRTVKIDRQSFIQTWFEENTPLKLLPSY